MATVALSGNDTIILFGRTFADLADGDCAKLSYPNEIAAVKTGKNNNSIYALNETGNQTDFEITLIRGSADDRFLNGLLTQQMANFAGFVLAAGEFIKRIGDGKGTITNDTYVVGGGVFTKRPEAKTNVEGDTKASVITYFFRFANSPRVLT